MSQSNPDTFVAGMSAEDRECYLKLRAEHAVHEEGLKAAEKGLHELVRKYGLPFNQSDVAILRTTPPPRFNTWWVKTPGNWQCSCCGRSKSQIVRHGSDNRPFGALASHHDHFREVLDNIVAARARVVGLADKAFTLSSNRFVRRFADGLVRFDEVVICEDCNNADGRAKTMAGAPEHLTFTVGEIRSFTTARPNQPHQLDERRVRSAFVVAISLFERRLRAAERLAELVLRNEHWLEESDWDHRPRAIDLNAEAAMRMFGLSDSARAVIAEDLLLKREARKRHDTWRTRARAATPAPLQADIDYVRASQAERWSSVPEDWTCPCCGRGKVDVIRPTKQHDWVFGITSIRFVDSAAPYGEASVRVCDACREAARGLNLEARNDPEIGEWPSPYLGIEDLRDIVQPQPHGLHNIDNARAMALLDRLRAISRVE